MPDDGACCCQDDTFQLKNGLLYCKPWLSAMLSSSFWEEAAWSWSLGDQRGLEQQWRVPGLVFVHRQGFPGIVIE